MSFDVVHSSCHSAKRDNSLSAFLTLLFVVKVAMNIHWNYKRKTAQNKDKNHENIETRKGRSRNMYNKVFLT